jgi:transcriptional regulator with XRE-family HTH domain
MTLGERIRQSRRARGMSQLALSRLVDISNNAMHKIEVGQTTDPRLSHVRAIAEALGVSLEYLAGLTDDPYPYHRGVDPLLTPDPLPPRSLMHRLLTTP